MKHHDLGSTNLREHDKQGYKTCRRASFAQFLSDSRYPFPKRRANISRIARIRSLFLLLTRKNRPIHHRTISDNLLNPRIERSQKSRRPAKTPPNHKHFIQRLSRESAAQTPTRETPSPARQPHPECPSAAIVPETRRHSPRPRDIADKTPNIPSKRETQPKAACEESKASHRKE